MDIIIKEDFVFLSKLVKNVTEDKTKWISNLFKFFGYDERSLDKLKNSSLVTWQINFLHECCANRNFKIIVIDLEDNLNCTIIGQPEPLTENSFQNAPPTILLRRMTEYSADPGPLWNVPQYYHVSPRKLIQLDIEKRFLYFFNKIQYVRMQTLVSNGMLDFSDLECGYWRFAEYNSESDIIKESFDKHLNFLKSNVSEKRTESAKPSTTTPSITSSTSTVPRS